VESDAGQGRCGHCGTQLPVSTGRGRSRQYCNATCRSRARRARSAPARASCAVRAGVARCAARATGAWYDTRGAVAVHTCAQHRELAGELLRARMPTGRRLDRWLPAGIRWSPTPHTAPPRKAYQLTVTLHGVHPPIWRRVHVRADATLAQLHEVIQVAMGWEGYHLWRFGPVVFAELCGEYSPDTALNAVVAKPGDRLGYLYDFGEHWIHHLELDKVITRPRAGVIYPRCSAGKRACPPEDCGGPWGYADTLKALRSRKGWRYQQARELCSTTFDPEAFDQEAVNTALAALSTPPTITCHAPSGTQ
jgi:hypothetical protein